MSEQPALRLWKGHTTHKRSVPFTHRFRYGLAMIDVDIDRLGEAHKTTRLFSVDRPNLFSFRRKDHAERKDKDLRLWAKRHFEGADIALNGGPVRLITFPRHLFYKFAPISLWLGYGPGGDLRGILYEVNNTFGETHTYVAKTPGETGNKHIADKVFHVSPFFDVTGKYQFTLSATDERLKLIVETVDAKQQTHVATIMAKAYPATSTTFLSLAATKPLSSLGVTFAIHWQALKLWLKGARYHSRPALPKNTSTLALSKGVSPARETAS